MNATGNLLMKFVLNGDALPAESLTDLTSSSSVPSPLLQGFVSGSCFEIDRFSFRSGTSGTEPSDTPAPPTSATTAVHGVSMRPLMGGGSLRGSGSGGVGPRGDAASQAAAGAAAKTEAEPPSSVRGGYQSWRAGAAYKYPVDLQPVTFTRSIESSSATLIQNCIDCVSYDSVTLIKRKPAGGVAAGEAYLRLDFCGVLVTGIDWSDADRVKETCTFICRSVTIGYRPQLPNGSLGAVISGFWSMVAGDKQVTYR